MLGTLRRDDGGARALRPLARPGPRRGRRARLGAPSSRAAAPRRSRCPPTPSSASATGSSRRGGRRDPRASARAPPSTPCSAPRRRSPAASGAALTGRLSLQTHPWLADHAVAGTVLLPGTAFVELALRAGEEVGCELLEELTLEAPLVLPEQGAVAAPGHGRGRRARTAGARSRSTPAPRPRGRGGEWTCHAEGVLSAAAAERSPSRWPPGRPRAPSRSTSTLLYDRLAEHGFEYGPAFQGLTAAWRDGEEIYAEVSLGRRAGERGASASGSTRPCSTPPSTPGCSSPIDADGGRGPEAALRLERGLAVPDRRRAAAGQAQPPGRRTAPRSLIADGERRAGGPDRLAGPAPDRHRECSLAPAPGPSRCWRSSGAGWSWGTRWMVRLRSRARTWPRCWRRSRRAPRAPGRALRARAGRAPPTASRRTRAAPRGCPAACAAVARRRGPCRLAPGGAHRGRVAAAEERLPDPALAALWGLLRSAQSEHPGRIVLIDRDGSARPR